MNKTTHYFVVEWQKEVGAHDAEHDAVLWEDVATAHKLLEKTEPNKKEYLILDRLEAFLAASKYDKD